MDIIQPRSYKHAQFNERLVASLIDGGILLLLSGVAVSGIRTVISVNELIFAGVYVSLGVVYNFCQVWWLGTTAGKQVMRIKVVSRVYETPDGKTAFLRECIGKPLSALPLGLGFAWALRDARQQTWHDKLARTYVVKTRGGELIRVLDETTYAAPISEQPQQVIPPSYPS